MTPRFFSHKLILCKGAVPRRGRVSPRAVFPWSAHSPCPWAAGPPRRQAAPPRRTEALPQARASRHAEAEAEVAAAHAGWRVPAAAGEAGAEGPVRSGPGSGSEGRGPGLRLPGDAQEPAARREGDPGIGEGRFSRWRLPRVFPRRPGYARRGQLPAVAAGFGVILAATQPCPAEAARRCRQGGAVGLRAFK